MGFFLVELPETGGKLSYDGKKAAVVEADDVATAKAMVDARFEGDSPFADGLTLSAGQVANYSGFRYNVGVSGPNGYDETILGGTQTVDQIGASLADKISGLPLAAGILDDNGVFTNDTTDLNDADAGDVALFPATPVAGEDRFLFGRTTPFKKLVVDVGTAGTGTYVLSWEYWNGSAWTALSGVVGTDFKATGRRSLSFTPPTDWVANTINLQGPFFYVRAVFASGTMTVVPLATQAFVGGKAAASYDSGTNVLTLAVASENLGDQTVTAEVVPPGGKKGVPQLVGTIVDKGSVGATLSVVLLSPTAIPFVVRLI